MPSFLFSPFPFPLSLCPYQMLGDLCGLAEEAAVEVASSLQSYSACKPAKLRTHIVRSLSLRDFVRCFDLPGKTMSRSVELCTSGEGGVISGGEVGVVSAESRSEEMETVTVTLKKSISESSLSDLSELTDGTAMWY